MNVKPTQLSNWVPELQISIIFSDSPVVVIQVNCEIEVFLVSRGPLYAICYINAWIWFWFLCQVRAEDVGTYECVVVNKSGKATCSARLTVDKQVQVQPKPVAPTAAQAPKLIEPMRDQHVDEGNPATFFCKIQGSPEPVIQWYYNNQAIKPSKYFRMTSQNGVHTLYITGAFPEDQGVYRCQALNQAGEVTCIAHLKVNGKWDIFCRARDLYLRCTKVILSKYLAISLT